ncbi:sugar-transfer associated ATP-grasp domain-containing protein [Halobium palmae]|uniref:Sugar-transfer associated ATP-grasp domain-containing protein n=1 Tax=Halobium palmae TaxID=1776492 RepID=A0ABD5RYI9_9EURY
MGGKDLHEFAKESYLSYRNEHRPKVSRSVDRIKRLIEKEVASWGKSWFSMPPRRRLWLWRNGFMSRSDALYDVGHDREYDRYLSDYQRNRAAYINGRRSVALDDKVVFHWMMEPFDEHRVDTYGLILDGRFHDLNALRRAADGVGELRYAGDDGSGASLRGTEDAAEWVLRRLRSQGSLVLKPAGGSGGQNVMFCSYEDGSYFVGDEERSAADLESTVAELDEYLVTETIEQAAYADELFPGSVNTLRVLTMFDPVEDEPFVAIAVQRIGTSRSAPVDNFSGGGLTAEVDRETGRLSAGATYPYSGSVEWHETHPDTATPIEGTEVTGWPEVREGLLDMAGAFSHTPYIGWDVVVTGDGEFAIIEANNCSDVDLLQIHRPLLDDARVRRFYAHHDVI